MKGAWILFGIWFALLVLAASVAVCIKWPAATYGAIPLLLLLTIWVILSLKIVGPDETAVKVYFGDPVAVCDSGFRFVPWFFGLTYLVRYSKKIYNLEYKGIEVITIAAEYPIGSGQFYGATNVKVDAAEYLNFPRVDTPLEAGETVHPLIKILRAGVPRDDDGLQAWTKETVEGAVRLAFGGTTWKQAAEEMSAISQQVENIFKDGNSTLVKAGFRFPGIKLVVSKIILPPEVEKFLTEPEKARLRAEAAAKDAEAQAIDRLETILYAIARSEGKTIDQIRQRVSANESLQAKLLEYTMGLHADLEKADRRSYFKFDSSGNSLLDAIALYKQFTGGQGGGNPPANPSNPGNPAGGNPGGQGGQQRKGGKKKQIQDMTDEEKEEEWRRMTGQNP